MYIILFLLAILFAAAASVVAFTIFFDQAVLVRRDTFYKLKDSKEKLIALTFDDGPSPVWTPKVLEQLKNVGVKATFFMTGEHVLSYPGVARSVAEDGHEIGNHSYGHQVLVYFTDSELTREIKDTERVIREATGVTTQYFRPPKAWLFAREKEKIRAMGYKIILWSLNSKDWVNFSDKYLLSYLVGNIRPGDILLFHDSGGAFKTEGGDRQQTIRTVPLLVEKMREKGFKFVTVGELLKHEVKIR